MRAVDGCACAVRECGRAIDVEDEAVRLVVELERVRKARAADLLAARIDWAAGMQLTLHAACWRAVTASCKRRSLEERLLAAARDTLERFDGSTRLKQAAERCAELVHAHHGRVVAFTGAGISVAAGIPDYRGTAGVDTMAEMGQDAGASGETDYTALQPTVTHTLLAQLDARGALAYTVTQNCDGLHRSAGTALTRLSELHGSVFVEYCERCGAEYERGYEVDAFSTDCYSEPWFVQCAQCRFNHFTGRRCTRRRCGGRLRDTIVNFGDDLHDRACGGLPRAERACAAAEVCIAIGSSLSVSPANTLPTLARTALVVVNLQPTDLDARAHVRAYAESDVFMRLLSAQLAVLSTRVRAGSAEVTLAPLPKNDATPPGAPAAVADKRSGPLPAADGDDDNVNVVDDADPAGEAEAGDDGPTRSKRQRRQRGGRT